MKSSTGWVIIIIIIVLGGWYLLAHKGSGPTTSTVPPPAAAPTATTTAATTTPSAATSTSGILYTPGTPLLSRSSTTTLGAYLVGSDGMTLYTFANDTAGVSNCSGTCADIWPPYLVTNTVPLKDLQAGVNGKVGVITRTDGTIQVTYDGLPLYFFKNDAAPGDTSGQGVKGVWAVAKP